ncbi:MAG: ester cyclase [Actinomycetota bacterium]|nr:ester cyclase [Candidatus Dormibacteraeota bacterium]MDQ6949823.1 ester cyclase [Actinomycetota bacterium]
MSEANKELVRKIQAAWNENATDDLDQYFAADFVAHSNVPGMPPGLPGGKAAHGMVSQFLLDRKVETLEMIAEGDKVLMRNRIIGTNASGVPWIGAEANGQPYDFESWSIYTIRDGKVVEHVGLNDVWLFAIQAGAIKPPVLA